MSTAFHPQTDGQTEPMNASMEEYFRVFVHHQQDDWVRWLPLAEFAANNGISELTKCTPYLAEYGADPRVLFVGERTQERNQRCVDVDLLQARMQQIHEHLQVEMRRSQAQPEEGTNQECIPALKISVSNGSGPSHWVWVWVETKPLPYWRYGLSINPNCPLGYGSMVNSQPV